MKYHAHVYFNSDSRDIAVEVWRQLKEAGFDIWLGPLRDQKVGPHPMPMFEVNFDDKVKGIKQWLMDHRQGLSVLIHEDTGNDILDHTTGACWLGEEVQLDFDFFRKIQHGLAEKVHV